VVCLDEKPVVLHRDVRPPAQAQPRQPAKRDFTPNRSGPQFARMLQRLAQAYPHARTIPLVLDNLSTHARSSLVRHLGPAADALWRRFTIHHTPKHARWLNQAEIEISIFARPCLGARRIASLPALRAESRAWNRTVNRQRLKINGSFSRLDAAHVFHQQLQLFKRSRHLVA
jgi:hypothetical protein